MSQARPKVLIVGGGVAALEVCLGLHWDRGVDFDITLVTESQDFVFRPLSVLGPFRHYDPPRFPITQVLRDCDCDIHMGEVVEVDLEGHMAKCAAGEQFEFDVLIVATGAEPHSELANAVVVGTPDSIGELARLVAEVDAGLIKSIVFCFPDGPAWVLPLYELAVFMADHANHYLRDVDVTLLTPQEYPLIEFGREVSHRVTRILARNDVDLVTCATAERFANDTLVTSAGAEIAADAVVAVPSLVGVPIPGLPHDSEGFLPVNEYGRVDGAENVFAAGDISDFRLKQGGVASQQADAVVAAIVEQFGGRAALHGFEPELRGLLLTPQGVEPLSVTINGAPQPSWHQDREFDLVASKIYSTHLSNRLRQLRAEQPVA